MSTRTLIEINHDRLHWLLERPDIVAEILRELRTSFHNEHLNLENAAGRALSIGHGVRLVMQYHHTTGVAVETDFAVVHL
ncbi:hypothetical protein K6W78_08025 [Burkholderia cepacia]|uniref:hypothetical protein n=1 Tax=Burkholderia cepacia TaxID=292 RepID=UPI001C969D08|nr:hypothetical protein [Burkholderia cepacia]MBY4799950.1 hypothetical protein [Burkholderia cepacia]